MMTQMCVGGGWFFGVFALIAVIVLILAAVALVKYLLAGHRTEGSA